MAKTKVLYLEDLRQIRCAGCEAGGSGVRSHNHTGEYYLHSRCHPGAATWVRFNLERGVLEVLCAKRGCDKLIVTIQPGRRVEEAEPGQEVRWLVKDDDGHHGEINRERCEALARVVPGMIKPAIDAMMGVSNRPGELLFLLVAVRIYLELMQEVVARTAVKDESSYEVIEAYMNRLYDEFRRNMGTGALREEVAKWRQVMKEGPKA